jgi:hypothetical protein
VKVANTSGNDEVLATALRAASSSAVQQMASASPKPTIAKISDWRLPQ